MRELYGGAPRIEERHRHRYEVNVHYKECLEATGMRFSGMSPDGVLPEIIELPRPSLVRRRAVSSGAEIEAVRPASAVRRLHRRRCGRRGLSDHAPGSPYPANPSRRRDTRTAHDRPRGDLHSATTCRSC